MWRRPMSTSPASGPGVTKCRSLVDPVGRLHVDDPARRSHGHHQLIGIERMSTRLFGTDGVRGVAGVWPLDPPTVARLGAAVVRARGGEPAARSSSAATRASRANGLSASSRAARRPTAPRSPAPASCRRRASPIWRARCDFDLGVVLSASHNPYGDNGIKVFSGRGEKFGEDERARRRGRDGRHVSGAWTARRRRASTSGQFVEPYLEYLAPSAAVGRSARRRADRRRHGQRRDDGDGGARCSSARIRGRGRRRCARTAATSTWSADRRIPAQLAAAVVARRVPDGRRVRRRRRPRDLRRPSRPRRRWRRRAADARAPLPARRASCPATRSWRR